MITENFDTQQQDDDSTFANEEFLAEKDEEENDGYNVSDTSKLLKIVQKCPD
jgi:hypothetical protein